ncbi:MAG: MerR family transcriptional regulator [Pseudolabrys sp.]
MDNKAPDAFRTISEVADELDLPQHVLRFWESRFSEIKPMKRGGGRRYYRPDDIDLLRGIRHLLYGEGYTIRGVQRILREQGVSLVQSIWQDGAQGALRADDADDAELVDETLEADDEEDEEEGDADERRGLRARITSLIGRDLNDRADTPVGREEPPLQSAPMPRIDPGDRVGSSYKPLTRTPAVQPAPADFAPEPGIGAPKAAGLSGERLDRLRTVLDDLQECRKLIDVALTPTER